MPINLDFSDVKPPPPLEEGNYLLKVTDCKLKPGKENPEYDVAHMRYEIQEPAEFNGRKVRDWISFHPDSMWSAKIWMAALLRCEEDEVGAVQLNESALVGELIGATIAEGEKYKDRVQYRIATYFNPTEYEAA